MFKNIRVKELCSELDWISIHKTDKLLNNHRRSLEGDRGLKLAAQRKIQSSLSTPLQSSIKVDKTMIYLYYALMIFTFLFFYSSYRHVKGFFIAGF